MGLTWSNATVKNGTLIVCNADFPTNDNLKNDVWNLWKEKKDELKSDGFSVSKDPKTNKWKLSYFHNVNETSYEKTVTGDHMWKFHFKTKVTKWESYISNSKVVKHNEICEKNEENSDGDDDVDENLLKGILNKYV